jgi:hypothetical protein
MFLATRILLLIFAVLAALVGVELFVFGAATVAVAVSEHRASVSDYLPLAGSLLIGTLLLIALKYALRPPAIRVRYWIVSIALPVSTGIGAFLLLR